MTSARKTISARVEDAMSFKKDVESDGNTFYITTSRTRNWTGDVVPAIGLSVAQTELDYWESLINGEKVGSADVKMGALVEEWTAGRRWKHYDHRRDARENYGGDDAEIKGDAVWTLENNMYSVFRCLNNNNGAVSTEQPLGSQTSATDASYILADGYQWKWLYNMSESVFEKFKVGDHCPVEENSLVKGAAVDGAIDAIIVEDAGSVYGAIATGEVVDTPSGRSSITDGHYIRATGGDVAKVGIEDAVAPFDGKAIKFQYERGGAYVDITRTENVDSATTQTEAISGVVLDTDDSNGMMVLTVGALQGTLALDGNAKYVYESSPGVNVSANVRIVETGNANNVSAVESFAFESASLSPDQNYYRGAMFWIVGGGGSGEAANFSEIENYTVDGDARSVTLANSIANVATGSRFVIAPKVDIRGDGENAAALAVVDPGLHSLKGIRVIRRGSGYSHATVDVDLFVPDPTGDIGRATAMISPPGGHGSNVYHELSANKVLVAKTLNEGTEKLETGEFHQIGLLRNPRFANVEVAVDGITSATDFADEARVYKHGTAPTTNTEVSNGTYVGTVVGSETSKIFLTDSTALIEDNDVLAATGETSPVTASANGTTKTNKDRTGSTISFVDQRVVIGDLQGTRAGTLGGAGTASAAEWDDGDIVYQAGTGYEKVVGTATDSSKAVLHSINRHSNNQPVTMALTETRGLWSPGTAADPQEPIRNADNGTDEEYEFRSRVDADLVPLSGDAVHLENLETVERADGTRERVKMVLRY